MVLFSDAINTAPALLRNIVLSYDSDSGSSLRISIP